MNHCFQQMSHNKWIIGHWWNAVHCSIYGCNNGIEMDCRIGFLHFWPEFLKITKSELLFSEFFEMKMIIGQVRTWYCIGVNGDSHELKIKSLLIVSYSMKTCRYASYYMCHMIWLIEFLRPMTIHFRISVTFRVFFGRSKFLKILK